MAKKKANKEYIKAQAFVDSWFKALEKNPKQHNDRACMLGWFTDAITAGYDAGYDYASQHNREL
jgi:hypothetical protein